MKRCSTCQEFLPVSGFHKNVAFPDGLQNVCKTCRENLRSIQKYGISLEEKAELIKAQGGVCEICERPLIKAHTDHDHRTGVVRGILCPDCNKGLGLFKDSQRSFSRAIGYLGKNEGWDLGLVASSG